MAECRGAAVDIESDLIAAREDAQRQLAAAHSRSAQAALLRQPLTCYFHLGQGFEKNLLQTLPWLTWTALQCIAMSESQGWSTITQRVAMLPALTPS